MKLLFLDIETSPMKVDAWGIWQQNIGINQIHVPTEVICCATKWEFQKPEFQNMYKDGRPALKQAWDLLDECDVVCHYNGKKFDIKHLNREFIMAGMEPPSPYRQIDLLEQVKRNFALPSYKLDYVVQYFRLGKKVKHAGHELWIDCVDNNDPKAWKKMEEYNREDTVLTEKLYHLMQPWIKGHPNRGLYLEDKEKPVCNICGSEDLVKKGIETPTNLSAYQRYKCKGCGANVRGRLNVADREHLLVGG